jgi:hypothetical protein
MQKPKLFIVGAICVGFICGDGRARALIGAGGDVFALRLVESAHRRIESDSDHSA